LGAGFGSPLFCICGEWYPRTMKVEVDVAVYDEEDNLVAAVEVRPAAESSMQWAAEVRRHLIERSLLVAHAYVLVVARDTTYVWQPNAPAGTAPATASTASLLDHYFRQLGTDAQEITPTAFETIVGIWLSDVTRKGDAAPLAGLAAAIADGRVAFHAAA